MRERAEQILKIVCVALGLLLAVELVKVAIHLNPLMGVAIPELPSLPADTNAPVKMAGKGVVKLGTNSTPAEVAAANTTNTTNGTNATKHLQMSAPTMALGGTNSAAVMANTTNRTDGTNMAKDLQTNAAVVALGETNSAAVKVAAGTNAPGVELAKTNGTNLVVAKVSKKSGMALPTGVTLPPGMTLPPGVTLPPGAMFPSMGGPSGKKMASLAPEIQARVDRVTDSEILGPVIHPMPMALLGIAGNMAFLRSPSGQTGLVKEGDSLGELKLLRIGTNRVLIEQDGQKKELMIFSGYGGESLLPKPTESSDETTKN